MAGYTSTVIATAADITKAALAGCNSPSPEYVTEMLEAVADKITYLATVKELKQG